MAENSPHCGAAAKPRLVHPARSVSAPVGWLQSDTPLPSAVHVGLKSDLQIDLQTYLHSDLSSIAQVFSRNASQGAELFITCVDDLHIIHRIQAGVDRIHPVNIDLQPR